MFSETEGDLEEVAKCTEVLSGNVGGGGESGCPFFFMALTNLFVKYKSQKREKVSSQGFCSSVSSTFCFFSTSV